MGSLNKLLKCFKKGGLDKAVWSYVPGEAGMQWSAWYGDKAAPHGPTGDIFTVAGEGPWGLNGHINGAPSESGDHPDFNFTDIVLIGRDNASLGPDQFQAHGFLQIPSDGFIVERNGNTGETGRVLLGVKDGCCNSRMALIADQITDTSGGTQRGLLETPYPVDAGECPAYFEMSDLSFFSGGQFQWGPTVDGPFQDIPVTKTRGMWVCRMEPCDYELQEGETLHAPAPCCPTPYPVVTQTEVPNQRLCRGPFVGCTGRSVWLTENNTWSPVFQNQNVPQTDTEWTQVGTAVTGPDCVHDCHAMADLGVGYALLRRIRMFISVDVRLLMNGVQVDLENDDDSWFEDERSDTNPDVINPIRFLRHSFGTSNLCAFNAPPGAVWTVEVRHGYRGIGAQPSSYFRYIGGLRSEGSFVWTPRDIVIGRT